MHYLIDGYNWLLRTPKSSHSLEQKRRLFLEEISLLTKDTACSVTIVFDSSDASRDLYSRGHFKDLEIIFTPKKQTADEYIESFVEEAKSPHKITVVTRDRELKEKCLVRGASVVSTKDFFSRFSKRKGNLKEKEESLRNLLKESPSQMARLIAIFEKKLIEDMLDKK